MVQGVRFDCAVAGAPWCTPFRGALLSGRYPHQTGVVANGIRLPPELPTVATAFGDAGYHTAYVGKWHLDGTNDPDHYVPPERRGGFRYWVGNEASNNQHEHYVYGTGRERPWRLRGYVTSRCRTRLHANRLPPKAAPADRRRRRFCATTSAAARAEYQPSDARCRLCTPRTACGTVTPGNGRTPARSAPETRHRYNCAARNRMTPGAIACGTHAQVVRSGR